MKRKLSKKKLEKMIASDFTDLSTEDIKALIQKEVNKEPNEIDTDYIDLYFELLSIKNNDTNKRKIRFTTPAKVLLSAAVLMVVFISTITVSAQFELNIPQRIARMLNNGNVQINDNPKNADTSADGYALLDTDLAKELIEQGITPVTFPEEMLKDTCKITSVEVTHSETSVSCADINFKYNDNKCYLLIEQMTEEFYVEYNSKVNQVKSGQMIRANGMDILVFETKNGCLIKYKDNLTNYTIVLECDMKKALKFAESIK